VVETWLTAKPGVIETRVSLEASIVKAYVILKRGSLKSGIVRKAHAREIDGARVPNVPEPRFASEGGATHPE
jgi:hypothetical protein